MPKGKSVKSVEKSDVVRVGIIGCGGIANGKHMPSISKMKSFGVEMVAFCDIDIAKAEKAAKEYGAEGAKVYSDYKKLLEDGTITAVHVCTPNSSHSFITCDALEAGKHVLCEKPMAKTYAEAKKMVETAKKTGKILTIGYQNRRSIQSTYLKTACENGDLGDIYMAKAHAIRRRQVPTWGVFLDEEKQGGGPLIDIGTHALDLTLWLMNNYAPKAVVGSVYKKLNDKGDANAWGNWDAKTNTVEDSAFGFITMQNGATIFLESSWALYVAEQGEAIATLCGTKGGADMFNGKLRFNSDLYGKLNTTIPELKYGGAAFYEGFSSDDPSAMECHTFYSAITKGTPLIVLPEQALVVTQLLEAIYESSRTGKQIVFDEPVKASKAKK